MLTSNQSETALPQGRDCSKHCQIFVGGRIIRGGSRPPARSNYRRAADQVRSCLNLRIAKALGPDVPPTLLATADFRRLWSGNRSVAAWDRGRGMSAPTYEDAEG